MRNTTTTIISSGIGLKFDLYFYIKQVAVMSGKTVPDRHWRNPENIRSFMLEIKSKLGFTSDEDWYTLNIEIIQQNGGKSVLATFKDSPQALIKAAFPELNLYPWRFKSKVPKNYWVDLNNQRYFIETEANARGWKTKDDYYKFTGKIIGDLGGYGAIKKYQESVYLMMKTLYPDYDWLPWKFIKIHNSFSWKKKEDVRLYCDWLYNELGYTSEEDWYNLTQDEIRANCGAGLVFHMSSPSRILHFAYPEINFNENKFCRWKSESKLFKIFQEIFQDAKSQFIIDDCIGKSNRHFPFDMGSESAKVIVECDGDQHFEEVKRFQKRSQSEILAVDIYKMKKAIEKGFTVIRFYQVDLLKWKDSKIRSYITDAIEDKTKNIHYISSKDTLYNNHIKSYILD